MRDELFIIRGDVGIHLSEIDTTAMRAQGPGGQNVNKVSSAIHLRFDIPRSNLPSHYKQRLLNVKDKRITKEGVIIIKAQTHRTQEKNREEAITRLIAFIHQHTQIQKQRIATKPSKASVRKRLDQKHKKAKLKQLRHKRSSFEF